MELLLHVDAGSREYEELREFARFCIERIEQDVGRATWWTMKTALAGVCFSCEVVVEHGGRILRVEGNGFDAAVAGRDAFCKIETMLRDVRVLDDTPKEELRAAQ